MQPAYYEDINQIKKKIWLMLNDAVKNRNSQFRIPTFICGDGSNIDGRIVVLRKSDEKNNLVQFHSDIRSDKIEILKKKEKMKVSAVITLKKDVLDPQGKVIHETLDGMGFNSVNEVRQGKYFEIDVKENDPKKAKDLVEDMCKKLLANLVIENYKIIETQ